MLSIVDLAEFQQKVSEMRAKIDNETSSPQKQLVLLQYIKDLCARSLEGQVSQDLEAEVKSTLFETERRLKELKIKVASNPMEISSPKTPELRYSSMQPSNQVLRSVDVGNFDPNASPILRRLHMSQTKPSELTSPKTQAKQKIEEKIPEIPQSPFPKPEGLDFNPFPMDQPQATKIAANLEISQLNAHLDLEFINNISPLYREIFEQKSYSLQIPSGFFDPIKSMTDGHHCEIVYSPGNEEFTLRDPENNKKTYFNGQFISESGELIKEGDQFILPVTINNQLSSLTITFHEK